MSGESDLLLDKVAESIADGDSIDWKELEKLALDDDLRRLLLDLRIVAGVADVHRSQIDDDAALTVDELRLAPAGGRPARGEYEGGRRVSLAEGPGGQGPGDESLGRWGHLLLLRKIGDGAFGEVYHAHDTWLDHPVALKLLKPEVAARVSPSRILHEARKLARVRHPNVVIVHGADRHDGRVGFWMDFVEGHTLEERVAEGRLSAGEATHIGQEVCGALAAVHQTKLIHRDVKAQNVMRASDGGRITLMDFGAGEFVEDASAGSRAQGTPLYLAPEIFEGGPASVRTDIYAVGVLLYYLVTGDFPVQGSSVSALAEAHRRGERRHLRDERPDLPDSFVTIVERALDPDPARRYASAGDMHAALVGGPIATYSVAEVQPGPGRSPAKAAQRTTLQQVVRAGLIVAGAAAGMEVLGFVASRAFEVVLRIDPDFAAGPADYFAVGAQALVPFVVYWVGTAAVLGALVGFRLLFPSSVKTIWTRGTAWLESVDPTVLASVVFLLGTTCWVTITWAFYDLFAAIIAFWEAPLATSVDLSILSPASHDFHRTHGGYSAYLSFILGLVAWQWFPRLEQRVEDASTVRLIKWATVAVALLVVATAVLPRRIVWESFEVVEFENRQAFVIGTSSEELLLYAPDAAERTHWRVRRDAPTLQRTGVTRKLFDRQRKEE
jgi:tRNA A-37 threonylcarbamoyl transferase component Bud32